MIRKTAVGFAGAADYPPLKNKDELAAVDKEMDIKTDPADIVRERVSTYICSKYQLPAFVMNTRNGVMVLCCCKQFADQLKTDFETSFREDVPDLKITFVVGSVDYL